MSVVGQGEEGGYCVHHPKRATVLRCGKCGDFICTRCSVPTPVGMRCHTCAQLRRLPQFDVGPLLLLRSGLAGLLVSLAAWWVLSYVPFLSFFLSILVGLAVGEAISRLARRRTNRLLEATAVLDVVLGLLTVESIRLGTLPFFLPSTTGYTSLAVTLALPALIASWIAVTKLH
jgi:hypothetical protein